MTEKLSQKDAVFEAVMACKDETGNYDRKNVVDYLVNMYETGKFDIKSEEKKASEKTRRDYIGSIVSNWTKKDARLAGGIVPPTHERRKHRPADDEMKRLMMAKVILMNEGHPTEEIDALLQQRTLEISKVKASGLKVLEDKVKEIAERCQS